MIGHDLHLDDGIPIVSCFFMHQVLEPRRERVIQDLPPVFGTKDTVVLTTLDDAMIRMIGFMWLFKFHLLYSLIRIDGVYQRTAVLSRTKAAKAGEARGVYALFL